MIPVMSSQELNEIFSEAQSANMKFEQKINSLKEDINKKITIIKYENDFISQKLDIIDTGVIASENLASFNNNSYGVFNSYGYLVHPKFKKTPVDIFNLKLPSGDNFFKTNLLATVNGINKPEYVNLLMADNHLEKSIVFEEFDKENISIEYELVNDYTLGVMRFNTIEIDPYMYGAYDLSAIKIYTLDSTNNLSSIPTHTVDTINNVGRTRVILPEKAKFAKVVFDFKLNYKTERNFIDIYPFGLKHIHFLECDYNEESFVITQVMSNDHIQYVMKDLTLFTTAGKKDVNAEEYDIEVYTDYINNTLTGNVILSSDAGIYRIPKNTKTLYVKIPLIKENPSNNVKEYLSLNGIKLNFTTNEEIII